MNLEDRTSFLLARVNGRILIDWVFSKMRSDAILATDARAQVITDPLAAATKAQAQRVAEQRGGRDGNWKEGRGGGRRGRGRGRRGRGAGGRENGNGMEVD